LPPALSLVNASLKPLSRTPAPWAITVHYILEVCLR
jgi:hypothetical protein